MFSFLGVTATGTASRPLFALSPIGCVGNRYSKAFQEWIEYRCRRSWVDWFRRELSEDRNRFSRGHLLKNFGDVTLQKEKMQLLDITNLKGTTDLVAPWKRRLLLSGRLGARCTNRFHGTASVSV